MNQKWLIVQVWQWWLSNHKGQRIFSQNQNLTEHFFFSFKILLCLLCLHLKNPFKSNLKCQINYRIFKHASIVCGCEGIAWPCLQIELCATARDRALPLARPCMGHSPASRDLSRKRATVKALLEVALIQPLQEHEKLWQIPSPDRTMPFSTRCDL